MRIFVIFAILVGLFGVFTLKAQAQGRQEGSVAIADKIVPSSESIVADFVSCVKELTQTGEVNSKDALKACKDVTKTRAKVVSDVSDDASGATKASRPIVVSPYYGGYGGYYGYSYRRQVVQQYRYHTPRYHTPRYHVPQYEPRQARPEK